MLDTSNIDLEAIDKEEWEERMEGSVWRPGAIPGLSIWAMGIIWGAAMLNVRLYIVVCSDELGYDSMINNTICRFLVASSLNIY